MSRKNARVLANMATTLPGPGCPRFHLIHTLTERAALRPIRLARTERYERLRTRPAAFRRTPAAAAPPLVARGAVADPVLDGDQHAGLLPGVDTQRGAGSGPAGGRKQDSAGGFRAAIP